MSSMSAPRDTAGPSDGRCGGHGGYARSVGPATAAVELWAPLTEHLLLLGVVGTVAVAVLGMAGLPLAAALGSVAAALAGLPAGGY